MPLEALIECMRGDPERAIMVCDLAGIDPLDKAMLRRLTYSYGEDRYKEGERDGYAEGHDSGYDDGWDAGREEGYSDGKEDGRRDGWDAAVAAIRGLAEGSNG